jgi:uncharacterized protein
MKRPQLRTVLLAITALGLLVWGAAVTIPNSFSDGDVISAAQMNANFAAVKAAVDTNESAVATLQTAQPGVAQVLGTTSVTTVGTTLSSALSLDVTAPAAGYALVTAAGEANLVHTSGTTTYIDELGIGPSATSLPTIDQVDIQLPSAAASGSYYQAFSVTRVFAVSAGTTTFYLDAVKGVGGTIYLNNMRMTAIYLPTAAGTVVTSGLQPAGLGAEAGPH